MPAEPERLPFDVWKVELAKAESHARVAAYKLHKCGWLNEARKLWELARYVDEFLKDPALEHVAVLERRFAEENKP
jgi:hypothetical protein